MNAAVCILPSDKKKQKKFSFFTILCSIILKSKQTTPPKCAPVPFILVRFEEELLDFFILADQIAEVSPLSFACLPPPPVPMLQTRANPFRLRHGRAGSGSAACGQADIEPLPRRSISRRSRTAKAARGGDAPQRLRRSRERYHKNVCP